MPRLSLLPRDRTFFDLFSKAGHNALNAARLLKISRKGRVRFTWSAATGVKEFDASSVQVTTSARLLEEVDPDVP